MTVEYAETTDHFDFKIAGDLVSRCCFDYTFTIFLQDSHIFVVIEDEFSLSIGDTSRLLKPPKSMAPALEVLHKPLLYLRAYKTSGRLALALEPDVALTVDPSPHYEAWHITGEKEGPLLVCMPRGKLAIWLPKEPA